MVLAFADDTDMVGNTTVYVKEEFIKIEKSGERGRPKEDKTKLHAQSKN